MHTGPALHAEHFGLSRAVTVEQAKSMTQIVWCEMSVAGCDLTFAHEHGRAGCMQPMPEKSNRPMHPRPAIRLGRSDMLLPGHVHAL